MEAIFASPIHSYSIFPRKKANSSSGAPGLPRAAVIILLGQSLNAPRNPTVLASAGPPGFAKMPVGGSSITYWDFFATNNTHTGHYNDIESSVDYSEGASQTPGAGIISQLVGGPFSKVYIGNSAIGGRQLAILMAKGPLANTHALIKRLCKMAQDDGFIPEIFFYSQHGEADAFVGTSTQLYIDQGKMYYQRCQLYAAQALNNPSYVAPVLLAFPAQQAQAAANTGEHDRNIKEAIRQLCSLPGFYNAGAIYQWPVDTDRIHPLVGSYVLRGEHIGRMISAIASGSAVYTPLQINSVSLTGATFIATFNKNVVKDTVLNVGQNLVTTTAEDGFEWFDKGVPLAINSGSLIYSGNTVTGTLASVPTGTKEQQTLRIAEQYTEASLIIGATNLAGSLVRSEEQWIANYLNTVCYDFAIPQRIIGVL